MTKTPDSHVVANPALDELVFELNEAFRSGTMDIHIKLGRIIILKLYGGDLALWRARGPRETSFRKLAARTDRDLAVSVTSLCRAVALCELTDRLGVSTWKHLGVSHLRGVLGLPEQEQRRLLTVAEREAWTVERLESEKAKVRSKRKGRRGRPPVPAFVKTVHRLMKVLDEPEKSFGGVDELNWIGEDEIARLRAAILATKARLEILEGHLCRRSRIRDDRVKSGRA